MSQVSPQMLPSYIGNRLRPNEDPQKVNQHYKFERNSMPKVRCVYHDKEVITHFCKEQQCILPLCPVCVKLHEDYHYQNKSRSNIVLYEVLLTEAYSNIASIANQICDRENQIVHLALNQTTPENNLHTNPIQLIDATKQQVINIVENYFQSLKIFVSTQLSGLHKPIDPTQIIAELKARWEVAISELERLNTEKSVQALIHHYENNLLEENQPLLRNADQIIQSLEQNKPEHRQFGIDIPQLFVDPVFLPEFLHVLENYAYFRNNERYPVMAPPPPPPLQPPEFQRPPEIIREQILPPPQPIRYRIPERYDDYDDFYDDMDDFDQTIRQRQQSISPQRRQQKGKYVKVPKQQSVIHYMLPQQQMIPPPVNYPIPPPPQQPQIFQQPPQKDRIRVHLRSSQSPKVTFRK
ncbi:hypothetical protein pb186bvf_008574 [Paramecium bursaria]